MRRLTTLLPVTCLLALGGAELTAEDRFYHLEIGDPERRGIEIAVSLDAVTDTRTGATFAPAALAEKLAGVRLLFVGESHTDMDFHDAQLQVIRSLHRAGREVLIGLEMYPYTHQEFLDQWIANEVSAAEFLERSAWYDTWTYHWEYYRRIFEFARDNGLGMHAVNTPRSVVRAVRQKGFENLTEEEAAHIPAKIDTDNDDHRKLFRSYFDEDDPIHASMTEEMWDGMFSAQCTWDATMAYNAIRALEEHGGDDAIMVVLIGSGHVAYGLGIERQAALWFDGEMASVIPLAIADSEGEPIATVRASYADFIWGLPPEPEPLYPFLGLSTRASDDEPYRSVIHISEGTPAERATFELGDVLLAIDGVELTSRAVLNQKIADLSWGDEALFKVRRGEEEVEVPLAFRRSRNSYEDTEEGE